MKQLITITKNILFVLAILLLSSCARQITIPMQDSNVNTGAIKIRPATPVKSAVVTIDGNLIWEKRCKVKSITLTNVPKGSHEINVTSGSWYYKEALKQKEIVNVNGNNETRTILISVPPYSTGYWIYRSVLFFL